MATHSSILAWEMPRTEEPDGPHSMGPIRVGLNPATTNRSISKDHTRVCVCVWVCVCGCVCLSVCVTCVLVVQSCSTLCDLMDCSPPGSSVHGILQARLLEWVAISRGSS